MSNLLKVFLLGFFLIFIMTLAISLFLYPFGKAIIFAFIFGLLYGLFAIGFTVRELKRANFIIDSSNKKIDKGLIWYLERIEQQAQDMRFRQISRSSTQVIYRPTTLYKIFESDIVIEISPYDISISCSRMMMRIILDYLDLSQKESDEN